MNIDELIELVQLHGKAVYGFCYKLTGNKTDTDDLYQDTFLKALELRHKLDTDRNLKAYLISIAIRLHKNNRRKFFRRQKMAPIAELVEAVHSAASLTPEDVILSVELHTMINNAAQRLGDKLKLPLYMYYTAEMSIEEIASTLGIPQGTVKSRLHKARATMKQMLEVDFT